jgi:hypothetical protein
MRTSTALAGCGRAPRRSERWAVPTLADRTFVIVGAGTLLTIDNAERIGEERDPSEKGRVGRQHVVDDSESFHSPHMPDREERDR